LPKLAWPLLAFAVFAGILAATYIVVPNEGWFADPSFHLATEGRFVTKLLQAQGTWLEGVDRHTYWVLPLFPVAQAGAYRLFGFSLWTSRSLSIFFGVLTIAALFFAVRELAGPSIALLAAVIAGTDFHIALNAATARMDSLCAALGLGGIALYLTLRNSRPRAALVAANACVALSGLAHPCGAVYLFALAYVEFIHDRRRITMADLAACTLPYIVAGGAYGLYVAQDPAGFLSQFGGNISGVAGEAGVTTRFGGLANPFDAVKREVMSRYVGPFGGGGGWLAPRRAQVLILILYWGALLSILVERRLRALPGVRTLFGLAVLISVSLCLFEGLKLSNYLIHIVPLLAALAAVWIDSRTQARQAVRIALIGAIIAIQAYTVARIARQNEYGNHFAVAASYLKQRQREGVTYMAGSEFAFALGFDEGLKDDVRLGYFTGERPSYYVSSRWYRDWLKGALVREPEVARHVERVLAEEYQQVLDTGAFKIYEKR
jgi:4-amino-4-deoxy-L-arabinose transferase-like glycosyltransferase